jgi:hypothetical protein
MSLCDVDVTLMHEGKPEDEGRLLAQGYVKRIIRQRTSVSDYVKLKVDRVRRSVVKLDRKTSICVA